MMGPVEYLVIEFPGNQFKGEIVPALAELTENGTIRILDLLFIKKDEDGNVLSFELSALALEEAQRTHGARVVSLAPGVIATDMQVQLRSADPALFSDRAAFVALHEQGQLDTPAQAAAKVLRVLARPDFGAEPVADVRTLA